MTLKIILLLLGIALVAGVLLYDFRIDKILTNKKKSLDLLINESKLIKAELIDLLNKINSSSKQLIEAKIEIEKQEVFSHEIINKEVASSDESLIQQQIQEQQSEEKNYDKENLETEIISLSNQGFKIEDIARKLGVGKGETELIIRLKERGKD